MKGWTDGNTPPTNNREVLCWVGNSVSEGTFEVGNYDKETTWSVAGGGRGCLLWRDLPVKPRNGWDIPATDFPNRPKDDALERMTQEELRELVQTLWDERDALKKQVDRKLMRLQILRNKIRNLKEMAEGYAEP